MASGVVISVAVEGIVDEAVARKLITYAGATPGPVYGKQGKSSLLQKVSGYNNAAQHAPWMVLVDLDRDQSCAPLLCNAWLANRAPLLCFRVAVKAVEAWLLADKAYLAEFLGVSKEKIPTNPEALGNPKVELVNLASFSRRRAIRDDMVPQEGSGRQVGPAYSSRLIEFVSSSWRPEIAARHCDSLRRAIACLKCLMGTVSTNANLVER